MIMDDPIAGGGKTIPAGKMFENGATLSEIILHSVSTMTPDDCVVSEYTSDEETIALTAKDFKTCFDGVAKRLKVNQRESVPIVLGFSPRQCTYPFIYPALGRHSPIVKHSSSIKNSCFVTCVNSALCS
jgi:hypothetical protein